jgi:hypothetical protein
MITKKIPAPLEIHLVVTLLLYYLGSTPFAVSCIRITTSQSNVAVGNKTVTTISFFMQLDELTPSDNVYNPALQLCLYTIILIPIYKLVSGMSKVLGLVKVMYARAQRSMHSI